MGRRPAEVAGPDLGRVFVKGRLAAGVIVQQGGEGGEVVEEVGVGEVAAFEVREEGGEADGDGGGEEDGSVGGWGEEVEEGREKEAGGFFFGGEAEEVGVEGEDFVFSGRKAGTF